MLGACALIISCQAAAITIVNYNTQQITYKIYTNFFGSRCSRGEISPGQQISWISSGTSLLHPLCGGEDGPKHVEVRVFGASGLKVNCTEKGSHNPRLDNLETTVDVKNTIYGVKCYVE